jgi:hypothetical protein
VNEEEIRAEALRMTQADIHAVDEAFPKLSSEAVGAAVQALATNRLNITMTHVLDALYEQQAATRARL